jgi:hypothetical protein
MKISNDIIIRHIEKRFPLKLRSQDDMDITFYTLSNYMFFGDEMVQEFVKIYFDVCKKIKITSYAADKSGARHDLEVFEKLQQEIAGLLEECIVKGTFVHDEYQVEATRIEVEHKTINIYFMETDEKATITLNDFSIYISQVFGSRIFYYLEKGNKPIPITILW